MQLNSTPVEVKWIRFNQFWKRNHLEHKKWENDPFNRKYQNVFDFKVKEPLLGDMREKEPESLFICKKIAERLAMEIGVSRTRRKNRFFLTKGLELNQYHHQTLLRQERPITKMLESAVLKDREIAQSRYLITWSDHMPEHWWLLRSLDSRRTKCSREKWNCRSLRSESF